MKITWATVCFRLLITVGALACIQSANGKPELIDYQVIGLSDGGRKEIKHWRDAFDKDFPAQREEIFYRGASKSSKPQRRVRMLADRLLVQAIGNKEKVVHQLEKLGFTVVGQKPFSPVFQVKFDEGTRIKDYDKALNRLRKASSKGLFIVTPDYLANLSATVPNDPDFEPRQADLVLIGAPDAWDVTTGSEKVVVAFIDSGMDITHDDLADNLFVNPYEIPNNGIDDDGNGLIDDINGWDFLNADNIPDDENGHGTAIAGVIGAVGNNAVGIAGTSWDCQLMPLKAGNSTLSWSNVIQAMDYAVWMKEKGVRIVAINNSYAGPVSDPSDLMAISNAVTRTENAGILFVAAAGNDASDNDAAGGDSHLYPSDLTNDNIISVAATNNNDELVSLSNYGTVSVDLAAPGASVYSTYVDNGYRAITGTSLSSARVSGLAGLLYSQNIDLDFQQMRDLIINSSTTVLGLVGKLVNPVRIDAAAAVQSLLDFPVVEWTDGAGKLFIPDGEAVLLEAHASDGDGYVVSVDFIIDGTIVGTDLNGVDGWSWNWSNPSASGHLQLRVTDDDGQQVVSWKRSYEVVSLIDFWRSEYWGELFDLWPSALMDADPDFDGIDNIWEYATGGNPVLGQLEPERGRYPKPVRFESSGVVYYGFEFWMSASIPSLELYAESTSGELSNGWTEQIPDYLQAIGGPDSEGFQQMRIGFQEPVSGAEFMRLGLRLVELP